MLNILISVNTMDNLSGSCVSTFTNAIEFKKQGHTVSVVCLNGHWVDNALKQNLEKADIKCLYDHQLEDKYDVIYCSEWCPDVDGVKIQTVRSEFDCESPIANMDFYVCIRPQIQEHIVKEHDIPAEKTTVIFNGVDRDKFKKIEKTKRDYLRIVAPCTIDNLRRRFLNSIITEINAAKGKMRMDIYSYDFGIELIKSPYVQVLEPKFDIEKEIADCDMVVGILLGRINLEANSCGVPSLIYDPRTLKKEKFFLTEKTFSALHDIKNVCKYLLEVYWEILNKATDEPASSDKK